MGDPELPELVGSFVVEAVKACEVELWNVQFIPTFGRIMFPNGSMGAFSRWCLQQHYHGPFDASGLPTEFPRRLMTRKEASNYEGPWRLLDPKGHWRNPTLNSYHACLRPREGREVLYSEGRHPTLGQLASDCPRRGYKRQRPRDLERELSKVKNQRDALQEQVDMVTKERDALQAKHDALQAKHDALQAKHDALQEERDALQEEH